MDPEAFLDIANQVVKLKMFPYFDIAHCTLCALAVREDLGSGTNNKPLKIHCNKDLRDTLLRYSQFPRSR